MPFFLTLFALVAFGPFTIAAAQNLAPRADSRFKVDLLLIVAHPDDESAISGFLARTVLDSHKRVAVIYGTRGDGGGNAVGPEQAAALGAIREIEARKATAALGIDLVWFLDGKDTPSQDVLQSLETWQHGASLERTVRLVRLTRPEVIISWLPQFVIGENHGDHQAAGVLATEAFDLGGNPTAFPSQVTAARNPTGDANLTEGLGPWQPKKLYFFSDRSDGALFREAGPRYRATDVSAATQAPYYQTAAASLANHLTQGTGARLATEAVKSGTYDRYLKAMAEFSGSADEQLILGKSLVGGTPTGDVFDGVGDRPVEWRPLQASPSGTVPTISLGGPWRFYREFTRVHEIEEATGLIGLELGVKPGSRIGVPIVIYNPGDESSVDLAVTLPSGWTEQSGSGSYTVPAGATSDLQIHLTAPATEGPLAALVVTLSRQGRVIGTTRIQVRVLATMPL